MVEKKKKKTPLKEQAVIKSFDPEVGSKAQGEKSRFIASGGKDSQMTVINPDERTAAFGLERANAIHAENEARKASFGQFGNIVAEAERGMITPQQAESRARQLALKQKVELQEIDNIQEKILPKKAEKGFIQRLFGEGGALGRTTPEEEAKRRKALEEESFGEGLLNTAPLAFGAAAEGLQGLGGVISGASKGIKGGGSVIAKAGMSKTPQLTGATPGAIKGATGTITRETYRHALDPLTGSLLPRSTLQTQRGIIGRPANTGVGKLFAHGGTAIKQGRAANPAAAGRFATNSKSTALTKSWLLKTGLSLFVIDKLVDAFGTFPWAAHNEREATDTLTFGMRKALDAGNIEQYDRLSAEFDEELEAMPSIWEKIPFTNVITSSSKGIRNAVSVKQSMDAEREKY